MKWNKVPSDAKLDYTQHTVAFPSLTLASDRSWERDQVNLGLSAPDGGSYGEMHWTFMTFSGGSGGVQMCSFGDGLTVLFDKRVQRAVRLWRDLPDPDAVTPTELIAILEEVGAVPSRFHLRPSGPAKR